MCFLAKQHPVPLCFTVIFHNAFLWFKSSIVTEINMKNIFKTRLFGGVCGLWGFLLKPLWPKSLPLPAAQVLYYIIIQLVLIQVGWMGRNTHTFIRNPEMSSAFSDLFLKPSHTKNTSTQSSKDFVTPVLHSIMAWMDPLELINGDPFIQACTLGVSP